MSSFLREFDEAIDAARQTGQPEWVWRSWFDEDGAYNLRPVARTMHPSFMGGQVPKWDRERDRPQTSTSRRSVSASANQDVERDGNKSSIQHDFDVVEIGRDLRGTSYTLMIARNATLGPRKWKSWLLRVDADNPFLSGPSAPHYSWTRNRAIALANNCLEYEQRFDRERRALEDVQRRIAKHDPERDQ